MARFRAYNSGGSRDEMLLSFCFGLEKQEVLGAFGVELYERGIYERVRIIHC